VYGARSDLSSTIKIQNDALPFDGWLLKVDQKTNAHPGSVKVIQTLSEVVVIQTIDALQFNDKNVLHDDVGKVVSNALPFVRDRKRNLRNSLETLKSKFSEQGTFINLLKKTRPKSIRDLKDGANHPFSQRIQRFHVCPLCS
jgi:hypothetical protein